MTEKQEEICENCGHELHYHHHFVRAGVEGITDDMKESVGGYCRFGSCSCKKFKAKNHSPQVFNAREPPKDTPSSARKGEGTHSQEAQPQSDKNVSPHGTYGVDSKRHPDTKEFDLSDCEGNIAGFDVYMRADVREFIKRLKEEINKKFEKMRKGWYKTDNAEVAQTRLYDSEWINVIDEIDKLAGKNLT